MDKVAIIIVHYNTPVDTKNCLDSLAKVRDEDFTLRTIVVDNGSKENFVLPHKKYKNTEVIRSDANLGFTGGNNLGFRYASETFNPDYFLLLNSDTLVDPDFVTHLWQAIKKDSSLGLVSPKIYFASGCEFYPNTYKKNQLGKVIWYAGGVIDWKNLLTFHIGVDEVDRGQFDHLTTYDFATGCSFIIRREVLAAAGVFDDNYFLYYEDVDLSLRVVKAGYKLAFCPQAHVWHVNGGSGGGSGSNLQIFYQTRNRLHFFFSHGSFRTKLTVLRFTWRLLTKGNQIEKQAALKFLRGQFGKEVVI